MADDHPIPGGAYHDQMLRKAGPLEPGWDGVVPPPPPMPVYQVKQPPMGKAKAAQPAKAAAKAKLRDFTEVTNEADVEVAVTQLEALKRGLPIALASMPPPTVVVGVVPVSLSDSEGEGGDGGDGGTKGDGKGKSAQAKKRARRVLKLAQERAFQEAKADAGVPPSTATASSSSSGDGIWTHVIEGVVGGVAKIEGLCEEMSVEKRSVNRWGRAAAAASSTESGSDARTADGDSTGKGCDATPTRLHAERGRVVSLPVGSAGGGDDAEQQKALLFCKKCEKSIALHSSMLLDDGGL